MSSTDSDPNVIAAPTQDNGGANPAIHGAGGDPKAALGAGPDPVTVSPTEITVIVVTVVVFLFGMLLLLWCHQRKRVPRHPGSDADTESSAGAIPLQRSTKTTVEQDGADGPEACGLSRMQSKEAQVEVVVSSVRQVHMGMGAQGVLRSGGSMEERRNHYDPTRDNN